MADAMEYLDENTFKVQAFRKAASAVMALDEPIEQIIARDGLSSIPGIGKSLETRIRAWIVDRDFSDLEEVRSRLPQGFAELLKVPGLGYKRIRLLQNERSITTLEELLDAAAAGRLQGLRAFPRKFVEGLPAAVERVMGYRGKCTLDLGLSYAEDLCSRLAAAGFEALAAGQCRRFSEIIERVEILVEGESRDLGSLISVLGMDRTSVRGNTVIIEPHAGRPPAEVSLIDRDTRPVRLLMATGSEKHVSELRRMAAGMGIEILDRGLFREGVQIDIHDEKDIYAALGLSFLPPEVREGRECEIALASGNGMPALITMDDIRGTIHNHTSASDGTVMLSDMVLAAKARGYEWIGISDHSRSAFYAGGLDDDAVRRQHREIEELNRSLDGITVFKGIESDILEDGSLDYPSEVLSEFDFVVASIHTHMDMDKKSMTKRIVKAVKNPFTTILGHPTGRLLLSREPFAVDMEVVLAAALESKVAVELNAHPLRLDLDWRLMEPFVSRGGIVALSPDAHTAEGLDDMAYGVMIARKGFLTKASCLNAWDVDTARRFFGKS